MGGRAGGGASGGMGSGSRGGNTERGYSASLARAVGDVEDRLRDNNYESLGVFDDTGKMTYFKKGEAHYVMYDPKAVRDKIVTHNHPSGASFSHQDIEGMVANNMKEMRIAGKEYTFSIKRPKGGWGATPANAGAIVQHYDSQARVKFSKQKTNDVATNRKLWIKYSTEATRKVAKYYGWDFSVKKN